MISLEKQEKIIETVYNKNFKNFDYLKDDLKQEALLEFHKVLKIKNIKTIKNIKAYFYKIAFFTMLKVVKKDKKYSQSKLVYFSELELKNIEIANTEDFETCFFIRQNIKYCLNKQTSKQVINLFLNGYNSNEIADKTNYSNKQVYRIIANFKKDLGEENENI